MKPGIAIGNYVLEERLDQGGKGETWLAYRELATGGRTAVVVKLPYAAGGLDPRVLDGLHDEARLHMQLQHSNIPRVVDLGLHEELPYFVMDYIAGRSLAELLVSLRVFGTPLRFELVAHIAREIGYALRYAHGFELDGVSRPVLHRDVAPENVLLSSQGAVYVVNFGVSEAAGIHSASGPANKGALLYRSPEHALGFPTPKSDGWGLGAIMWEMLEGRPFRGDVGADSLHRAAKEGRYDPLTREAIPEVLQQVTEGLLAADVHERLTLDEALRLLEAPELPVQRMALADVLKECFGDTLHRLGRSRVTSEPVVPIDPSQAVTKVIEDDGPFGLNAWRMDAEDDALPPPPAWASMDDGPVDSGSEPVPPPSEAHEHAAEDAGAAEDDSSESRSDAVEPPPTHDTVAPMLAVLDMRESSSAVLAKPVVPPAPEATPPPAAAPRRTWSPALLVPVLALVVGGIAWAVWPSGTQHDARAMTPTAPARTGSETPPDDQALTVGPTKPEPPGPEPVPSVGPEPVPTVGPEATVTEVPTDAPIDSEPIPGEPPVAPAVDPEPTPKVDPGAGKTPAQPTAGQSSKPKPPQPKPAAKKAAGPPVPLAIELKLMADMELEINGVHFSLGLRRTTAKTTVAPGKVRVRWRRPLGEWKRKTFDVEAGASYDVRLDDRGPTFKQRAR